MGAIPKLKDSNLLMRLSGSPIHDWIIQLLQICKEVKSCLQRATSPISGWYSIWYPGLSHSYLEITSSQILVFIIIAVIIVIIQNRSVESSSPMSGVSVHRILYNRSSFCTWSPKSDQIFQLFQICGELSLKISFSNLRCRAASDRSIFQVDLSLGPARVSRVVEQLQIGRVTLYLQYVDLSVGPARVSRVVDDENEAVQSLIVLLRYHHKGSQLRASKIHLRWKH